LAHVAEVVHQIGQTLASDGRRWHQTERILQGLILPVQVDVHALLGEGELDLIELALEVLLRRLLLLIVGVASVGVLVGLPQIESVNLVERDTKWSVFLFEQLNRLERLLLQPVHDIDNQHGHIAK